jgi:hypothetical protein
MTQHFNARGRASSIDLRRAMRNIGGIGWTKTPRGWFHPATGLRR